MISFIKRYVHKGCNRQYDDETNRRIVVINLFSALGFWITLLLGIRAFIAHDHFLCAILLVSSLMFAASQRIQIIKRTPKGRLVSMSLLLGCLMTLMTTLIITGGSENTGPLWIYTVPPVTMFFAGFQRGLVATCAFTILICIVLFMPQDALLLATYTLAFKTRLILSFVTVTFLSAFYEYSREKSYNTALFLSEQFERQAQQDPLTQLLNRRGAQQRLEQEKSRLGRNNSVFSVAIGDIDRFKSINDTHGHKAGDEILKRVASIFQNRIRKQDIAARWGGEEFLFIFPDTDENSALTVVEEVRQILSNTPIMFDGFPIKVTASFGVCEVTSTSDLDSALTAADKAMYRAKVQGRNKALSHKE